MKGKNTLRLNIETMNEAAQMWVDSAITTKPKVVAVRQISAQEYANPPLAGYYEIDVETSLPSESPAQYVPEKP